jgi:S1/P1 nuclease
MRRSLAVFCAALLISSPAYPWGAQGHAAIGLVAQQRLSASAREHVKVVLGNDNLAAIASWMDEVLGVPKGFGPLAGSREAHDFAAQFPHSNVWHYVNLPLGETKYADDDPFSKSDDVVHQLNLAIRVLDGTSTAVSPRIALYMVVHLVGDLHQPLHVACGYYDLASLANPQLLTDPQKAFGRDSDAGGNLLKYGNDRWDELHGYWDLVLPEKIAGAKDAPALAQKIASEIRPGEWDTPGDYHTWAEQWATESLRAARQAYAGIRFGVADNTGGKLRSIRIQLPAGYDTVAMPIAEARLAQAGYHLAELLNAIRWPDARAASPAPAP